MNNEPVIFVIANNLIEFKNAFRQKSTHYLNSPNVIRGRRNIRFHITDLGWKRENINEIIQQLIICNMGTEQEAATRRLRLEQLLYA